MKSLRPTVKSGRLRATDDQAQAIRETELSFVCVGTPSQSNGNLDLTYIRRVCEQIGQAIKSKADASHRCDSQHDLAGDHAEDRSSRSSRNRPGRKREWTSAFATIRSSCVKAPR